MRNDRLTFFNTSLVSVSKSMSIFKADFADVSTNDISHLKLNSFPIFAVTSLLSRSDLLPTTMYSGSSANVS